MRTFLTILLICVALAARGETIVVRSGEHDGFSRLVLPMAKPSAWTFGRTLDGYELRLGRPGVLFDLSGVFDRIPRLRLADLGTAEDGTRLTLQLSCACHAEIFEFRPNILVIDIRPGPASPNSPFERMLEADGTVPANVGTPPVQRPHPRPSQDMPVYDWRSNTPALPRAAATASLPPPAVSAPAELVVPAAAPTGGDPSPPPLAADPRTVAARTELLQQLGRATSQGLLSANPQAFAPDLPAEPAAPPVVAAPTPTTAPDVPAAPNAARLRAQTALDREVQMGNDAPVTPSGGACLPDSLFDFRQWGDNRSAPQQIEARRAALVGEFDRPSVPDVAALMRLYLYLGFGAEARGLPAGMRVAVPDGDVLSSLADILDNGRARSPGRLAGQAGCSGAVSLWSVLAEPVIAPGETVDTGAIVRSFSALPLGLRRLLGPGLSVRFLDHGDVDVARTIRDAITRAPGEPGRAVDLLSARIDLADGKTASAEAAIRRVAAGDGPSSPDALVMLVAQQVANGGQLDSATVDSIAALARQYRGTGAGRRLARAHLLALALAGNFDGAFDELVALRGTPDVDASGTNSLWALLANRGSDEALLRHALVVPDPKEADRNVCVTVATRLIALGFPAEGLAWLAPLLPPTDTERLLAAQARLAMGDTKAAAAMLDGIAGADAAGLRAATAAQGGDHSGAEAAYLAIGAASAVGSEAWRAGDWRTVATMGRPEQQAAVAIVLPATAAPTQPSAPAGETATSDGPLAHARALVDGSAKARGILQTLLSSTEIPPGMAP